MPDANSNDGFSGRVLVISMLVAATILGVIAAIYHRAHPPLAVPATSATTQTL